MSNKKATKRALLTSVMALALCVVMLVGTTFAWFTDTAKTNVNKIQAGNLDVKLEMADGTNEDGSTKWVPAEGETLSFLRAAAGEVEPGGESEPVISGKYQDASILWEPGCTYELPQLRVVNNGNLALKYKIAITGIAGDSKLCEVIDWYYGDTLISKDTGMAVSTDTQLLANTKGDAFTIKGHMQETAGNEYQGLAISGIAVTVYATQAAVESDSYGPTYDADAEYKYVETEADLKDALQNSKNVILNNTITLTEILTINNSVEINGNGNALLTAKPVQVVNNANVTFRNVSFSDPVNHSSSYGNRDVGSNLLAGSNAARYTGKLVLDSCTFTGTRWDCIQAVVDSGAEIVINNCQFELNAAAPTGNKTRFIHVEAAQNSNADVKVTLTNNFFGASTYINEALIDIDYINLAGINFGGNNVYTDTTADIFVCGPSVVRTISKDDAYKALGGKAVAASTQDELNTAITGTTTKNVTVVMPENSSFTLDNGIANEGAKSRNVTFKGDGTQTVDVITKAVNAEGGMLNYQRGSTFTFENVTVQAGEGTYDGIVCDELTYKNCTIKGKLTLYGKATFINCTFENNMANQYSIWTWGGTDVTFEGCTFNTNGKAILLFGEEKTTSLTVNNCIFNDRKDGAAEKAAIEVGEANYGKHNSFTLVVNNATVNGFADGKNTGSKIWANKNSMDAAHLSVTIDGTKVL